MKTYEAWVEEDEAGNVTEVTFAPLDSLDLLKAGAIGPKAKLLYRIDAATWEEASAIHNLRMGYEPYVPHGDSAPCPKCGSLVYPLGSGECWKCGERMF